MYCQYSFWCESDFLLIIYGDSDQGSMYVFMNWSYAYACSQFTGVIIVMNVWFQDSDFIHRIT